MCHYITIVLPVETSEHRLRKVLRGHCRTFSRVGNTAAVRRLLDVDIHYGITTRQHCDCGTAVGAGAREGPRIDQASLERRIDARRRKWTRRGWSASQVDRWAEDQRRAAAAPRAHERKGTRAEAEQWARLMQALVGLSADGRAWLLLHRYSGPIERERIGIRGCTTVPAEALTPEFVSSIKEDVLYEFRERLDS